MLDFSLQFVASTSSFVIEVSVTHIVLFPCWVLVGQTCQAKTWQEVNASNAPSKTLFGHTAVMDAQQRMWIFGGGGCVPRVKIVCACFLYILSHGKPQAVRMGFNKSISKYFTVNQFPKIAFKDAYFIGYNWKK